MKKAIAAVLLSLALAVPAAAGGNVGLSLFGPYKPVVGRWANYHFEISGKVDLKGSAEWAIVSREGKEFWMEMTDMKMDSASKHSSVAGAMSMMSMKMLIDSDGRIKKMYAKTPMGVMAIPASDVKDIVAPHEVLKKEGMETVLTSFGKIQTEKYGFHSASIHGNVWAKKGVGPFGVVKSTIIDDKDHVSIKLMLRSHGAGAEPEISISKVESMNGMSPGTPDMSALMRQAKQRREAQAQAANQGQNP
jgi:hypothetical protein